METAKDTIIRIKRINGYTAARSVDKRDGKRDKVIKELMAEVKSLKTK